MTVFLLSVSLGLFLLFSIYVVKSDRSGYAALLFAIYHILFFLGPGIIHSANNVYPFYDLAYDYEVQVQGAVIVAIFSICSILGYLMSSGRKQMTVFTTGSLSCNRTLFVGLVLFFLLVQVFGILSVGLDNLIVRRAEFDREAFGGSFAVREFLLLLIRSVSFVCLVISLYFMRLVRVVFFRYLLVFSSLSLFLIINYPLALPRFVIFSYVIFFICLYLVPTIKVKFALLSSAILGVTTIFPLISHFTRGDGTFKFDFLRYYGNSGDFDGFQSLLNVVMYVEQYGYKFGYQISGAIFSLVPRSLWMGKPLPTGAIAADHAGYDYLNVSSPIVSEMYIDFGYFGIIFISFALGFAIRKLDNLVGVISSRSSIVGLFVVATFISYVVIILRGPLIGAVNHFYIEAVIMAASVFFIVSKFSWPGLRSLKVIR